jgi:hypothetical protein
MNGIHIRSNALVVATLLATTVIGFTAPAAAHCDSLDGPIIPEARLALEAGDATAVLKWVSRDSEAEIRAAFARALSLRSRGEDVREMADQYFLETLIRIHRQGEGEPYTGLKPAGSVAPIFKEADATLGGGDARHLAEHIAANVRAQIEDRFEHALGMRTNANESVEAGRSYVAAYVDYMHFVETLDRLLAEDHDAGAAGHDGHQGH